MVDRMNIGIDFAGVANTYPKLFKEFTFSLHNQGHKIYFISGLEKEEKDSNIREKFLRENEIYYDKFYAVWQPNGDQKKADLCKSLKIDIMIDDSIFWSNVMHNTNPKMLMLMVFGQDHEKLFKSMIFKIIRKLIY